MLAETVISKEVYRQIRTVIRRAWQAALPRPPLRVSLRATATVGEGGAAAPIAPRH